MVEVVKAAIPEAEVKVVAPLELTIRTTKRDVRQYLTNAWNTCKMATADREKVVLDHVRSVAGSAGRIDAPTPDKKAIIPMIKDETFVEGARKQLITLAAEHLAADIWIVYAVDLPESIAYLSDHDRQELKLDLSQLRSLAIQNLRRLLPDIQRHGQAPAFMLTAGGNMEASLLLLDDLWDVQEKLVDGDIVAAVPARDVLVFTGSRSKDGLDAIRGSVKRVSEGGSYPISRALLVRQHRRWVSLREQIH